MLTFAQLCAAPRRLAEVGDDVLIAASGTREVLVREPNRRRDATMVFQHETIQIMKAERAEQLDKLRQAIAAGSPVVPLRKKPQSMWDHVTVGRTASADIVLEDPAVSSVHAHFVVDFEDGSVSVQDVGSSNGTFLNRQQIQPHVPTVVRSGDCIRFGQSIFYYVGRSMLRDLVCG